MYSYRCVFTFADKQHERSHTLTFTRCGTSSWWNWSSMTVPATGGCRQPDLLRMQTRTLTLTELSQTHAEERTEERSTWSAFAFLYKLVHAIMKSCVCSADIYHILLCVQFRTHINQRARFSVVSANTVSVFFRFAYIFVDALCLITR